MKEMRSKALVPLIGALVLAAVTGCAQMDTNDYAAKTGTVSTAGGQGGSDTNGRPARCNSTQPGACTPSVRRVGQDDRGAAPAVEDHREVLRPKVAYNPHDIDPGQLGRGRSAITGYACSTQENAGGMGAGSGILYARNTDVQLFPYSDYLMEVFTLLDKNRYDRDKVRVEYEQSVLATRLDGRTNADAKFEFRQLKPGHYILAAQMGGSLDRSAYVPNSHYDQSSNTIYTWNERRDLHRNYSVVLYTDVVIRNDGDVVEVKLAPPWRQSLASFIPFIGDVGGGNNNLPTVWGCNPNKSGPAQHLN